jgi:hypothetical protein
LAFLNPRFSIPGDHPGEAANWTLVTYTSAERIAGFGPEPYAAWEDFERWYAFWQSLDHVDIALAFFDPNGEAIEDFEETWNNDFFYFELPLSRIIWAVFDGLDIEKFEIGWGNDAFDWDWGTVVSLTAIFNGNAHEGFEIGWQENESFIWHFEGAFSEFALFDTGSNPYENFSGDWTEPDSGSP